MASRLLPRLQRAQLHLATTACKHEADRRALLLLTRKRQANKRASSTTPTPIPLGVYATTATLAACTYAYADASTGSHAAPTKASMLLSESGDDAILPASTSVEAATQTTYPNTLPEGKRLVGTSCRVMRKLVKVYSIGVYVDPNSTKQVLGKWTEFSATELLNARAFWSKLCSDRIDKTFRLVVVREVGGHHMCAGFERALLPRAKEHAGLFGGLSPKQLRPVVKDFCQGFCDVGTMKVGSQAFLRVRGNRCELCIDGRVLRIVENDALAWALADMYLGEDSVVTDLRDRVAEGVVGVLDE